MLVYERIKNVAAANPKLLAVITSTASITYTELIERVEAFSATLRLSNVKTGATIAFHTNANIDYIVGLIACYKNGLTALPIDLEIPQDRQRSILALGYCQLVFDQYLEPILVDAPHAPQAYQRSDYVDGGYLLFTSGTTGAPKGIRVGEASLCNLIDGFQRTCEIGPGDRCALWSSIGFDVSMYEIFSALLFGASLHIPNADRRKFAEEFVNFLSKSRITSCYVPSFALPQLTAYSNKPDFCIKKLLVGVEPIQLKTLLKIKKKAPFTILLNGYGPTEATICATAYQINGDERPVDGYCPIGTALPGYTVTLRSSDGQEVKNGTIGEICISGVGVVSSYINNEDEWRFVPGHEGYFRTGDLGVRESDGNIYFRGREDSQIKIRGNRVELIEVKRALEQHPQIVEALPLLDVQSGQLVAHLVCSSNFNREDIYHFLAATLPNYMIPSRFFRHDEFRRTANGKIDVDVTIGNGIIIPSETAYQQPTTKWQRELLSYFSEKLMLTDLAIDQDLTSCGLDSLARTKAYADIMKKNRLSLSAYHFATFKTVRELADYFEIAERGYK